ncbi:MAG: rhodanese-like domain-containing protein [Comamonadaceae bacterium]|nr:rhodanese-like domain-containing protein [Comamonadaceae bacterium]
MFSNWNSRARHALGAQALAVAALLCAAPAQAASANVQESAPMAARQPIWIDVRTPQEHAQGHIPQSLNIPYDEIAQRIAAAAPDKNAPIALYCRSGRRSEIALQTLLHLGYTQVENLGSYDFLRSQQEGGR